jgi:hypothetical protein
LHLCADSVDGDDLFHGYFPIRISKGQAVNGERETRRNEQKTDQTSGVDCAFALLVLGKGGFAPWLPECADHGRFSSWYKKHNACVTRFF